VLSRQFARFLRQLAAANHSKSSFEMDWAGLRDAFLYRPDLVEVAIPGCSAITTLAPNELERTKALSADFLNWGSQEMQL
jgi:hypothetical protein